MVERRTVKIEKVSGLKACVRPGRRSGCFIWFEGGAVPLRDGQSGTFEIERERKAGSSWRVVGRLEPPIGD